MREYIPIPNIFKGSSLLDLKLWDNKLPEYSLLCPYEVIVDFEFKNLSDDLVKTWIFDILENDLRLTGLIVDFGLVSARGIRYGKSISYTTSSRKIRFSDENSAIIFKMLVS